MPQKVLIPEKVKSVACGGTHTVALTGNSKMGRQYTVHRMLNQNAHLMEIDQNWM